MKWKYQAEAKSSTFTTWTSSQGYRRVRESAHPLYMCFVNLEKAYDHTLWSVPLVVAPCKPVGGVEHTAGITYLTWEYLVIPQGEPEEVARTGTVIWTQKWQRRDRQMDRIRFLCVRRLTAPADVVDMHISCIWIFPLCARQLWPTIQRIPGNVMR